MDVSDCKLTTSKETAPDYSPKDPVQDNTSKTKTSKQDNAPTPKVTGQGHKSSKATVHDKAATMKAVIQDKPRVAADPSITAEGDTEAAIDGTQIKDVRNVKKAMKRLKTETRGRKRKKVSDTKAVETDRSGRFVYSLY